MSTPFELSKLSKTTTPPHDSNVPDEERDVGAQQRENQSPTLFTLPKLHSVSKLTEWQFIAMRAVWPKILKADKFPKNLFGPEIIKKAREVIANFSELKAYLRQVGNPDTSVVHRDMGAFLLVRDSQKRIPSEPAKGRQWVESDSIHMEPSLSNTRKKRKISQPEFLGMASEPDPEMSDSLSSSGPPLSDVSASFNSGIIPGPTKDEQLVNDALLLFLRTLLVYQSELKCHWAADRSPFSKAIFGDNSMTARTDGYLEANGEVFAIVEVKPNSRDPEKRPEVLWQETGEMIAWIMHDDKHKRKCQLRRRLLVSQDNHEIYLTIADYDNQYLAYLKNGDESCGPSLKMQTYGPWNIAHPSHMERLALIILCVAFEVHIKRPAHFARGDSKRPAHFARGDSKRPAHFARGDGQKDKSTSQGVTVDSFFRASSVVERLQRAPQQQRAWASSWRC
ncbi:hypothetical protein PENPOL_c007G05098 [Penicillium polonicum]|uniref:Uncharacterized protein n=1 Tax=Penicillium polonicum TaxID=60169 RepID=A0A1V6NJW8_PENPO|nr:hypothetical protein PENPOL_c007G05098 [Penicillium polonicum]